MSVSTPQTTMLRPIWKPSGKHLNALKTHRGRASRHHGSKIRVCLRGSTPFNGKKNNVEETVHPPKHTNGNGDAPSHYGLLLINHEMASSPSFEPRRDIGGVIFPNLRSEGEIGAKERCAKLGNQFL